MSRFVMCLAAVAVMLSMCGCGEVVPPGKKVIILFPSGESEIKTEGAYRAYGRDKLYFIDQQLKSFEESLEILCADDINMSVDVKAMLSFRAEADDIDFIKEKVPSIPGSGETAGGKELSLDGFYDMVIKDLLRSSARITISKLETDNIRPSREQLEVDMSELFSARVEELKLPVRISAVLISNIDYPEEVTEQRKAIKNAQLEDQRKAALAEADMAEAQRQSGVETELAKVRMIKAQAQADENAILAESLTVEYLSWRQLEVMETVSSEMAKGQNNVVFIMPYEAISRDTMNTAMVRESIGQLNVTKAIPVTVQNQ